MSIPIDGVKIDNSQAPTANVFVNIEGYSDIKNIIERALETDDNYNLLLCGPPASSKTLFLMGILDIKRDAVYFDGSNTTSRILDVLEEKRPKIILIDELDKMSRQFGNQLLNFMEWGHVKVDMQKKQYDFKIKGAKVFEITRISRPLQSRFRRLHLPPYAEEQFLEVSVKALPKLKIAHVIRKAVWKRGRDVRDVMYLLQKIWNRTVWSVLVSTTSFR